MEAVNKAKTSVETFQVALGSGPREIKGYQAEAEDGLKVVTKEFHEAEKLRRESTATADTMFVYCIIFPATPRKHTGMATSFKRRFIEIKDQTEEELEDDRNRILKAIKTAGFQVELIYSSTKKQIICKIGSNDARFLKEAENTSHKLQLDRDSVQHVLELKVRAMDPDAEVTRPKNPVFLGFENYTAEEFERIQHIGGDAALPLFLKSDYDPADPEAYKIDLETAQKTFKMQSSHSPYQDLHMKYASAWEDRIIAEHHVQLYRTYRDGTILRNADRVMMTLSALGADPVTVNGVTGGGLDLKSLKFKKKILAYYPLEFSKQTRVAGDLTSEDLYQRFLWRGKFFVPWIQPIQDVRDYAGEKIAYYFAFLAFYSKALIFIAVPGLAIYLVQLVILGDQLGTYNIVTGATKIVLLPLSEGFGTRPIENVTESEIESFLRTQDFVTDRTQFATSIDGSTLMYILTPTETANILPIFSFVVALWAAFFLEAWKRHQSTLAYRWGVSDYERHAEVRAEFESKFDVPDAVTGLPTPYRSPWDFGMKVSGSIAIVGFAVCVTVGAFAATYVFKAFMSQNETLNPTVATQVALVLNSLVIMFLSQVFRMSAQSLTNWENHRTDVDYEDHLIGKTFVFSFFNSYTTLIYFAFFRRGTDLWPLNQTQYCVAELQFHDIDEAEAGTTPDSELFSDQELIKIDSCYSALGYSLMIIFCTQIFVSNAIEIGYPLITKLMNNYSSLKVIKQRAADQMNTDDNRLTVGVAGNGYHEPAEEKAEDPEHYVFSTNSKHRRLKSPAELQFMLTPYETPFYDYLELALQFGYVTLFVAAFPLAPFLALLNNFVEVWVDANKVCRLSRKPNFPRAQDIGTWLTIFTILSYMAVVVNAGVLVFTSVEIVPIKIENPENRVWTFLGFILGVFGIKYFVDFFVKDTPQWVKLQLERQAYFEQKIFYDDESSTKLIALREDLSPDDIVAEKQKEFSEFKVLDQDPYLLEMVEEMKAKMREKSVDEETLFARMNANNAEFISLKDLKQVLLSEETGLGRDMDSYAIRLVVDSLDVDGDEQITKEEFRNFLNEEPTVAAEV